MAEESKMKLGARVKLFIATHLMPVAIGVFASFLLLGYLLLFSPELNRIRETNISQSLEEERRAKTEYLTALGELSRRYQDLDSEKIADLEVMIPDSEDIPELLAMFEAAATNSDVSLTAINFTRGELDGAAAGIKDLEAVNISISVANASYARFKLFLERLETNLRLFDIRSMDMNPSAATYNLSIRAYVRKPLK